MFCTFNNNKPWFTAKLRQIRHAKDEAYRSGTKEIRVAKRSYTEKLKIRFSANDPVSV